eukprot:scaffold1678_cov110-Isochrysis_galbana.AAC.6
MVFGLRQPNVEPGLEADEASPPGSGQAVWKAVVGEEEEEAGGRSRVECFPPGSPGAPNVLLHALAIRGRETVLARPPPRPRARVLVGEGRARVAAVAGPMVTGKHPKMASDPALHGPVPVRPSSANVVE